MSNVQVRIRPVTLKAFTTDLILFRMVLSTTNIALNHGLSVPWSCAPSLTKTNKRTLDESYKSSKTPCRKQFLHTTKTTDCLEGLKQAVEKVGKPKPILGSLLELAEYEQASPPKSGFQPQAGGMAGISQSAAPTEQRSENVQFNDQMPAYVQHVEGSLDPTRTLNDNCDLSLDSFFSRPVKIREDQWDTGTIVDYDINPWSLFFENHRVINRIANYKLLRANLHIKVIINGNGFHYGRAIMAYHPLAAFDGLSEFTEGADLVQLSQLPHVFLNPTDSTGGEIVCPFFYPTNYLDVPESAWSNMGMLRLRTINGLKHANGATDKVTISVFAWAEDIKLSVLTSVDPSTLVPQTLSGFVPQSGEVDEANKTGMVSGPATALVKISNAASMIPMIKPWAMATSTVASAVAVAAKALGYSRPTVTKNPEPYRPTLSSQLATTTTPDTAIKLTVDDKQELTVDPRIAGISGDDPMSIKDIAKKESYLISFPWSVGDPPEFLLWNSRITPVIWREGGTGESEYLRFPACAFAAIPFKYWTGTMNFRFQVVASAFHKGRLKISYDPDHVAGEEYNTNHTQIIDIADKQDFTISIGNGQITTLLDHGLPGITLVESVYDVNRLGTDSHGNGVIAISVLNELTVPDTITNNDVEINVYVSMGDDFEVFVPDNHFQSFVFKPDITPVGAKAPLEKEKSGFTPQSGSMQAPDAVGMEDLNAPQQMTSTRVGPDDQDLSLINKVFIGETILSFRQLLKRYNLHRRHTWDVGIPGSHDIWLHQNIYPYLRGAVQGAIDVSADGTPYSYCNTILLHWVVAGFSGWRGSIRTKMHHTTNMQTGDVYSSQAINPITRVERHAQDLTADAYFSGNQPSPNVSGGQVSKSIVKSFTELFNDRYIPTGVNGMVLADASINPIVEFEMPYYSQLRFEAGKPYNVTSGFQRTEGWMSHQSRFLTQKSYTDLYYATGEDFQVYFYNGLPRMYFESDPPAALVPP